MKKKYDYDRVLTYTGSNGTMDSLLGALQSKLNDLKNKVDEAQESYHGAGADSVIVKQYQALYDDIKNYWTTAYTTAQIVELIYTNAETDKKMDEAGI